MSLHLFADQILQNKGKVPKPLAVGNPMARLSVSKRMKLNQEAKFVAPIQNYNEDNSDTSSLLTISEPDDRDDPNFGVKSDRFTTLPTKVQQVIAKSWGKAKHSDFYYKLENLNFKISLYQRLFGTKMQ